MLEEYDEELEDTGFALDDFDETREPKDIEATLGAVREAWKLVPTVELSELLDLVTDSPFCELTNDELIGEINDWILQNQ